MHAILTLAKKELGDYFTSPIASVFITVFLLLSFGLFFSGVFLVGEADLRLFFAWLPVLFIVFLPAVTMGKWAEEKKTGTFEILMTLPVSAEQVVLGKFLAGAAFLLLTLILTLPLAAVVARLGDLDAGRVMGGYVGIFLLGAAYLALGLFVSSLTKSQIVAFLVTVLILFLFYILAEPIVTGYLPKGLIPVFQFASFNQHFVSMARGVIDSRDGIYLVSITGLFLYLNTVSLGMRKA